MPVMLHFFNFLRISSLFIKILYIYILLCIFVHTVTMPCVLFVSNNTCLVLMLHLCLSCVGLMLLLYVSVFNCPLGTNKVFWIELNWKSSLSFEPLIIQYLQWQCWGGVDWLITFVRMSAIWRETGLPPVTLLTCGSLPWSSSSFFQLIRTRQLRCLPAVRASTVYCIYDVPSIVFIVCISISRA